jgi:hypothetical protein
MLRAERMKKMKYSNAEQKAWRNKMAEEARIKAEEDLQAIPSFPRRRPVESETIDAMSGNLNVARKERMELSFQIQKLEENNMLLAQEIGRSEFAMRGRPSRAENDISMEMLKEQQDKYKEIGAEIGRARDHYKAVDDEVNRIMKEQEELGRIIQKGTLAVYNAAKVGRNRTARRNQNEKLKVLFKGNSDKAELEKLFKANANSKRANNKARIARIAAAAAPNTSRKNKRTWGIPNFGSSALGGATRRKRNRRGKSRKN